MNDCIREHYLEAGNIASLVLKEAGSYIKAEVPLLEVAEYVEKKILDLGGGIAFPCNISVNEVASHFTPDDDTVHLIKGDVVKIDIGVHIEGYIADTARTFEVATWDHSKLIEACEEALDNAILSIRDGVQTCAVGKVIEETIKKHGFNPIKHLTGHSLEHYDLHSGITIPNYGSLFSNKIKKDMVLAIEPFATYGNGNIRYGKTHIFAVVKARTSVHKKISDRFGHLPFARRWIPEMNNNDLNGLREFSELIEADGKIVAQSEHTVIVSDCGCEIITK